MRPTRVIVCLVSGLLAGCSSSRDVEVELSSKYLERAGYSIREHCVPHESNSVDFSKHFLSINNRGQYQPVVLKNEACGLDANGKAFKQEQKAPDCLKKEEGCSDSDKDLNDMHQALIGQINTILDEVYSRKHLPSGKKHHLIIFIHGGLNNHDDSVKRGVEQLISMKNFEPGKNIPLGAEAAQGRYATNEVLYPLFINWPSGLFDAYFDKTFNYSQGQYDTSFQKLAGPLFFLGNIGETIARAPANCAKSTGQ
jgi:hypothetical protein